MDSSYKEKKRITIKILFRDPRKMLRVLKSKLVGLLFKLRMIFSRTEKPLKIYPVIYIRTPKCASSSIILTLKSINRLIQIHGRANAYKKSELSEENLKRKVIFLSPGNIDWFRHKHPEIWDAAYKFSVVRNPYDKAISAWRFLDDLKALSLVEALKNPPQPDNWRSYHHFTRTLASMLTVDEKLCTDFIIKYENLDKDFALLMVTLGIEGVSLPETNQTFSRPRGNYIRELDANSKQLVENIFNDDFVTFNYSKI